MVPLTNEEQQSYEKAKVFYILQKSSKINTLVMKNIAELYVIVITQVNTQVLYISYII